MKKRLLSFLATGLFLLGVAGMAQADLTTIGTATYGGSNYNLIWSTDFGQSIVYLDYSNLDRWAEQLLWAHELDANLSYNIDIAYNVSWHDVSWLIPDETRSRWLSCSYRDKGVFSNLIYSEKYWTTTQNSINDAYALTINMGTLITQYSRKDEYHYGVAVRRAQVTLQNNTIPFADAGPDQAITEVGSIIQLDGSQSYDLEGDPINFNWTMLSKPVDSNAALSDSTSPTPTFQADIHGDYVIELVVSDASSSESDQVVISFENVIPVANAGTNHSVVQGETICFDGSGSSDANLDSLSYSWSLVSTPAGSSAFLDDPAAVTPCITTDLAGNYEVSLIVNDGFVDSEPSTATVLAITLPDAIAMTLQEMITVINDIDLGNFKNKNMQNTLTKKINATLELVEQGAFAETLDKLQNDILAKTDGCATSSEPDKNDWIQDCGSQELVYPLVIEAIGNLESM